LGWTLFTLGSNDIWLYKAVICNYFGSKSYKQPSSVGCHFKAYPNPYQRTH